MADPKPKMVRIISVQGNVVVKDQKNGYMEPGRAGMLLKVGGDYLIATDTTSHCTLDLCGKVVELKPLSSLRMSPQGKNWWARHGLVPDINVKLWLGKVWSKMEVAVHGPGGKPEDLPTSSGGGGVRG